VSFREEHRNTTAHTGRPVSMFVRNLDNEALAFESTKIIGRLSSRVGRLQKRTNLFDKLTITII